ncbi:hypothetical protein BV898_15551 [Hypsibius exemplaris]|uniref:Glycosyl transferase n=1 Tax=Hypsibius exemplaris TaxID=2072580 RepID=A0A9X6RKF9_HYPEX|nr:hypothetical protein BV898_15551 [Hypsibius exemplaris]
MSRHLPKSVIALTAFALVSLVLLTYHRYRDVAQLTLPWSAHVDASAVVGPEGGNNADPLIVHYIHLQTNPSTVSFLDCMAVVSVMKNLQPDFIYYHTNYPDHWPFDPCNKYHDNWTTIKIIPVHRRFRLNGKRIHHTHHEADVIRLENLQKYGGLALDFDVIVINGAKLRALLREHACIICDEPLYPQLLNSGFLGCKLGARFPGMMLHVYHTDYRPSEWVYNSGNTAFFFWSAEPALIHVVPDVCNYNIHTRGIYLDQRGSYLWEKGERVALHTFLHGRDFDEAEAMKRQSSFGDLLRWIMKGAPVLPSATGNASALAGKQT